MPIHASANLTEHCLYAKLRVVHYTQVHTWHLVAGEWLQTTVPSSASCWHWLAGIGQALLGVTILSYMPLHGVADGVADVIVHQCSPMTYVVAAAVWQRA